MIYHKLGGLKPQKFILAQFQRPEVQSQYWAGTRLEPGYWQAVLALESPGKNGFLASPSFWERQVLLGLWQHPSALHFCGHIALLSSVCNQYVPPSFIKTLITFTACLDSPE